jgi:hypothetical protein
VIIFSLWATSDLDGSNISIRGQGHRVRCERPADSEEKKYISG